MLAHRSLKTTVSALLALAMAGPCARAAADSQAGGGDGDIAAELQALKARVAELEAKSNENWMNDERAGQIRAIVQEVLKDARTRTQPADGPTVGYKDGFFIQTPDGNFKLTLGGYLQARYEFEQFNATNGRTLPPRTTGSGSGAKTVIPSDPGDGDGFSVRKARITLTGNVFSPDLTFKLEGDFYGSTGGAFTVTDAFIAYRWTDQLRIRAGSYKVPFAKAELTSDPLVSTAERAEVMAPFDPVRALGVSLYGDLIKDRLSYEVSVNDGGQTNTLRRPDTVSSTPNLDNRLAFYGRMQFAGNAQPGSGGKISGGISDFADEADLRSDNETFIWLLGAAVGYESQNAAATAFPSPQGTTTTGLSNGDGPGFTSYTLNGDLFRATVDWSAKYQGWSFLTAAYFQQINANPGNTSSTSSTITTGPFGATDSSFFQHAYYGQIGYFVIPRRLELIGRAGLLFTEGYPNVGEVYTLGANYYVYGHNLKIQSDVTYTPEAPFTDSASGLLQNTHDLIFRVQLQAKF